MVDLYDLAFAKAVSGGGGSPAPTPTLITKTITANGNYNAASDNADGYSSVTVNVPAPTVRKPYVQFTGTQFIRTGFTPNNNYKQRYILEYSDYIPSQLTPIYWEYIFGGYSSTQDIRPGGCGRPTQNESSIDSNKMYAIIGNGNFCPFDIPSDGDIHTYTLTRNGYSISVETDLNGNASSINKRVDSGFIGLGVGLDYAGNPLSDVIEYTKIKVYRFAIEENDVVVKNFVPRVQNDVPGLYETVNNVFYPSEGSEDFVYGEKVIQEGTTS